MCREFKTLITSGSVLKKAQCMGKHEFRGLKPHDTFPEFSK
jgi:hypothetical protein